MVLREKQRGENIESKRRNAPTIRERGIRSRRISRDRGMIGRTTTRGVLRGKILGRSSVSEPDVFLKEEWVSFKGGLQYGRMPIKRKK